MNCAKLNSDVGIRETAEAMDISYGSTWHIVDDVFQKKSGDEVAEGMLANIANDPLGAILIKWY